MIRRYRPLIFLVIAVALLSAYRSFFGGNMQAMMMARMASMPSLVDVTKAERRALHDTLMTVGTLRGDEAVAIKPEVAGVVDTLPFQEGQHVQKGSIIVTLDSALQKSDLAQAEAALTLARASFQRAQTLIQKGVMAQQTMDQAQAQLRANQAVVDAAKTRLEKMTLRAPFAGTIGLRTVSPGAYVTPGTEIVTLVKSDGLKVDFTLPELFANRVTPGMAFTLAVDGINDTNIKGEVVAIDSRLDETTRAVTARGYVANAEGLLKAGSFARLRLTLDPATDQRLVVPEAALVPQGDKVFVFRIADNTAQRVAVKTGLRGKGFVEIIEGLNENDIVVIAGQMRLREGGPVKARDPVSAPAGQGAKP